MYPQYWMSSIGGTYYFLFEIILIFLKQTFLLQFYLFLVLLYLTCFLDSALILSNYPPFPSHPQPKPVHPKRAAVRQE